MVKYFWGGEAKFVTRCSSKIFLGGVAKHFWMGGVAKKWVGLRVTKSF